MPSESTLRLTEADRTYLWHPFTQMDEYWKEDPLLIESAEGCWLIDSEGRRYLDGVSSLWVNVHGHHHPQLDKAVSDQLKKVAHSTLLGMSNVPAIELARRLVELSPPGLSKVFYSENGSSSVEVALKMSFQYWQQNNQSQRTKFLRLENGYHGDTLGAVSVGGIDRFHSAYEPLLFPSYAAPSPYCYRCPLGRSYPKCELACAHAIGDLLEEHHKEIAAVIVEAGVQAAAGIITAPVGYLRIVRDLCDRYGVHLIVDEVATGFGRTGSMFACEKEGICPDLMVLGKGITGGYLPLSAVLTTEELFTAFLGPYESFRTFFHGHTYTGNPICCAVALANLDIFEKEGTLALLQPKIEKLSRHLVKFQKLNHVGDVRQRGFMVGIELVSDRETKAAYLPEKKVGWQVAQHARDKGVVIRPLGDVVVLMPPLVISDDELKFLTDVIFDCIREVTDGKEGN